MVQQNLLSTMGSGNRYGLFEMPLPGRTRCLFLSPAALEKACVSDLATLAPLRTNCLPMGLSTAWRTLLKKAGPATSAPTAVRGAGELVIMAIRCALGGVLYTPPGPGELYIV